MFCFLLASQRIWGAVDLDNVCLEIYVDPQSWWGSFTSLCFDAGYQELSVGTRIKFNPGPPLSHSLTEKPDWKTHPI